MSTFSMFVPISLLWLILSSPFSFLYLNSTMCECMCILMHAVCIWAEFYLIYLYTDHHSVKQKVQDRGLLIVGWMIKTLTNRVFAWKHKVLFNNSLDFLICVFCSFLRFLGILLNHKHITWLCRAVCLMRICTHPLNIAGVITHVLCSTLLTFFPSHSDASKIRYCWFVQFLFGCCQGSALCWVWLLSHIL